MQTVSLKKWGNSIGVRIPAALLKEAHLEPGEILEICINEDGALILTPTKQKQKDSRVRTSFQDRKGQVALDQLCSINRSRIVTKLGKLDQHSSDKILDTLFTMFER